MLDERVGWVVENGANDKFYKLTNDMIRHTVIQNIWFEKSIKLILHRETDDDALFKKKK